MQYLKMLFINGLGQVVYENTVLQIQKAKENHRLDATASSVLLTVRQYKVGVILFTLRVVLP